MYNDLNIRKYNLLYFMAVKTESNTYVTDIDMDCGSNIKCSVLMEFLFYRGF